MKTETQRGVSPAARKEVIERSHGWCELFCVLPTPGNQIVHSSHQGMGGAVSDADCNQARYLPYGCQACHDRLHGPGMPWKIVEIDLDEGILEIVDAGAHKVGHDRIFFHLWPMWRDAIEEYPLLVDAVRRQNEAAFDVAKHLAPFKPTKKGPELFRVCPEIKEFGVKATYWTFVSLLGMTSAKAKELMPVGEWINEEGMGSVRGVDMDAIDALRTAPEEEVERLMGLTAKPVKFWKAIEDMSQNKHGRRAHYLKHNKKTGKLEDLGLLKVEPDVAEVFRLIKGRIVRGGEGAG